MKLSILILSLILWNPVQPTKPKLVGKWMYAGKVNQKNQVDCCAECPDLLEFRSNGSYVVLNDCFGADPKYPSIESGKWELVETSKKIRLKERKFATDQALYTAKKVIEMSLVTLEGKYLKVKYAQGNIELYTKVK